MGLSPELFKRLSRLNRQRAMDGLTTADALAAPGPAAAPDAPAQPLALETLIPGAPHEARGGRFYLIRRRAEDFSAPPPGQDDACDAGGLVSRYRRVFFGAGRTLAEGDLHESLRPLVRTAPTKAVYLDIETCGLAGEPLFLVGLMRPAGGSLAIEQYLARDYAEEGPVLDAVWRALGGAACLVTFNGKTFDMPTVAARSLACGIFEAPGLPPHVDLLFEARRRWRGVLPNCRLQTLEQLVCGRHRVGDIPGHEIPAAYHEFVRAGQGDDVRRRNRSLRTLQAILHHNALDLLTMADLVSRILAGEA